MKIVVSENSCMEMNTILFYGPLSEVQNICFSHNLMSSVHYWFLIQSDMLDVCVSVIWIAYKCGSCYNNELIMLSGFAKMPFCILYFLLEFCLRRFCCSHASRLFHARIVRMQIELNYMPHTCQQVEHHTFYPEKETNGWTINKNPEKIGPNKIFVYL